MLPINGRISLGNVNTELGLTNNTRRTLGQTTTRNLFGVLSGRIKLSDGYGKSNIQINLSHIINNPNAYGTVLNDFFGLQVATNGTHILVGVPEEDDAGGQSSGKVYIFNMSGSLLRTINNPNPVGTSLFDTFGSDVAISGNIAAISAPSEDDSTNTSGLNSGKVYIYNITTGSLLRTINNPNPVGTAQGDFFGTSLSIDGNYIAIGASGEDSVTNLTSNRGKVYIYDVTSGSLLRTINNPVDNSLGGQFGNIVKISGNYIAAGVPTYIGGNGAWTSTGRTYVFDINTGNLVYTLENPNPNADGTTNNNARGDFFGNDIAMNNTYLAVVATGEDEPGFNSTSIGSGKVYIYDVTTGTLLRTINNPNAVGSPDNDAFGTRIDIYNNLLIASSVNESSQDNVHITSGVVYVFDITSGGLITTLWNPNPYGSPLQDRFGQAVAISGNNIIVSATHEDEVATGAPSIDTVESGKVYIYTITTS